MADARKSLLIFVYLCAGIAIAMNIALVVVQYRNRGNFSGTSIPSVASSVFLILTVILLTIDRKRRSK